MDTPTRCAECRHPKVDHEPSGCWHWMGPREDDYCGCERWINEAVD